MWGTIICILISAYSLVSKSTTQDFYKFFSNKAIIALSFFLAWTLIQLCLPTTNDIDASTDSALLGLSFLGMLFLLSIALKSEKTLKHLFNGFIILALIHVIYGLYIYLSGENKLLWMDKVFYLDRPTGFFVHPNHFAAYISLSALLLGSCLLNENKGNLKSKKIWLLLDNLFEPKFLILLVFLVTLLMTKSIGAIGAGIISVAGIIVINIIKSQLNKTNLIIIGLIVSCLLLVVFSVDFNIIQKEASGFSHTFDRRIALSLASWDMLKDHWIFGVGGGSFYSSFSQYRNLDIGNTYYNYAHNDYLQFWIEYGIAGAVSLVAFIYLALRKNYKILKITNNKYQKSFAITSIVGTATLAIHSLVDFPLHIPAYSIFYLSILSVNLLVNNDKENTV